MWSFDDREIEELLNGFFKPTKTKKKIVNGYSTDEELVLVYNIPGIDPKDIEIGLEDNTITVTGKLKKQFGEKIFSEFQLEDVDTTVIINRKYDLDTIKTKYENGLLILTINKNQKKRILKL